MQHLLYVLVVYVLGDIMSDGKLHLNAASFECGTKAIWSYINPRVRHI